MTSVEYVGLLPWKQCQINIGYLKKCYSCEITHLNFEFQFENKAFFVF